MKNNEVIIAATTPERYKFFDNRSIKPIYIKEINKNKGAVIEKLDYIKSDAMKRKVEFVPPNNIALQLSVVEKSMISAKKLNAFTKFKENSTDMLIAERVYENSKIIYEHIALIQEAIVFGYTALETFANLSVPKNYQYTLINNKKF